MSMTNTFRMAMSSIHSAAAAAAAAAAASQCGRGRCLFTNARIHVSGVAATRTQQQDYGLYYGSSFVFRSQQQQQQGLLLATATTCSSSNALFHTSRILNLPLDEFRDVKASRQDREAQKVGRAWSVTELRRKSYNDLHKLWLVLYKEKNMLLTEQQLCRRRELVFPQPERMKKVSLSMASIRHVLGERKREKIKIHLQNQNQQSDEKQQDEKQDQQQKQE